MEPHTTALYCATLHLDPCETLVNVAKERGQQALIGKVCRDRQSPEYYIQSLQQNLDETKALIQYIHATAGKRGARIAPQQEQQDSSNKALPLILALITPQFIPTCTPQLMTKLWKMAAKYDCHITSHVSESVDEVSIAATWI